MTQGVAFVCSRAKVRDEFLANRGFSVRWLSCIGQVGAGEILSELLFGAQGVLLLGCQENECRHTSGPANARKWVNLSKSLLKLLGFDPGRVELMSEGKEIWFKQKIADFVGKYFSEPAGSSGQEETGAEVVKTVQQFSSSLDFVCLDCGRCSGICPVARTGMGFSPRRLIKQAIEEQAEVPTKTLYACIGCDLCSTVCPSGKSIGKMVKRLRSIAYNRGMRSVLAHGGLLLIIAQLMAKSNRKQRRQDWLKPDLRVSEKGDTALFVGCLPYFDVIFAELGVNPVRTAQNAVRSLNAVGVEPVLLDDERCCGHDLLWLGDIGNAVKLATRNIEQLQRFKVKRIVFLCPECLYTFRMEYPELVGEVGMELVHITQFLLEKGFQPETQGQDWTVTYHDPCRLSRQLGISEPPRVLLQSIAGINVAEMQHIREQGLCCGGTSWLECGAAVKLLQQRRIREAKETGAQFLVTACSKCEIHLRCALNKENEDNLYLVSLIDLLNGFNKINEDEPKS